MLSGLGCEDLCGAPAWQNNQVSGYGYGFCKQRFRPLLALLGALLVSVSGTPGIRDVGSGKCANPWAGVKGVGVETVAGTPFMWASIKWPVSKNSYWFGAPDRRRRFARLQGGERQ